VISHRHDWIPPVWGRDGKGPSASCIGTYVVRSLPKAPVATLETVCANASELAGWADNWLRTQLDRIRVQSTGAEYNFAFMYLIVVTSDLSRPCIPATWKVEDFGRGAEPHAPSDWAEVPLVDLVSFAIADLAIRKMVS
jgi:hypothetical protein